MNNNSLTKINVTQLQELVDSMNNTKNSCESAISGYQNAINSLVNSGQIMGNAINVFEENLKTINIVKEQFSNYCEEVKKAISTIIEKSQAIDNKYAKQYEELLSINPMEFNSNN